jgi:two-component sensor histidine kinase
LNFSEYVTELAENVKSSYANDKVRLKLELEPATIHPDKIIPCGLIINELLSNSLKYAFPNGSSGEVLIHFYTQLQDFVLEIADDGVGLDQDIQIESSNSLGLHLVSTFTTQLGGELKMSRSGGTRISIRFPR